MLTCRRQDGEAVEVRQRGGSLLVETVVCTVLLSVIASIIVPSVRALSQQRKATRFDTLCLIELNNLATGIRHGNEEPVLTEAFSRRYPDVLLEIQRQESSEPFDLPAADIVLRRPEINGLPDTIRKLTIWLPAVAPTAAVNKTGEEPESAKADPPTAEEDAK